MKLTSDIHFSLKIVRFWAPNLISQWLLSHQVTACFKISQAGSVLESSKINI